MSPDGAAGADRIVPVGRVAGVFGVRGWVRVRSDTDPAAALLDYVPWQVRSRGEWVEREPREGRVHGAGLVVRFEGVEDRDAAGALVGSQIGVRRGQLPALGPDEHYWTDLIGLEVRTREGAVLGTVTGLIETGANDVLVVRGHREVLVPYLPGTVVERVDLPAGLIEVDWEADY